MIAAQDGQRLDSRAAHAVSGSIIVLATIGSVVMLVGLYAGPMSASWLLPQSSAGAASANYMALVAISVAAQILDSAAAGILRGRMMFRQLAMVEFCTKLALVAAILPSVHDSADPVGTTLLLIALANAASCVSRFAIALRALPSRVLRVQSPLELVSALPQVFEFAKWYWTQGLAALAFNTIDKLVIGRMLGASAVGTYAALAQVAALIHYFPAQIQNYMLPAVTRAASLDSGKGRLRTYLLRGLRLNVALTTLLAMAAMLAPVLLEKMGPAIGPFRGNYQTYLALVVAYSLISLNTPLFYFLLGIGRAKVIAATNSVAGLTTLVAQWGAATAGSLEAVSAARAVFALAAVLNAVVIARSFASRSRSP